MKLSTTQNFLIDTLTFIILILVIILLVNPNTFSLGINNLKTSILDVSWIDNIISTNNNSENIKNTIASLSTELKNDKNKIENSINFEINESISNNEEIEDEKQAIYNKKEIEQIKEENIKKIEQKIINNEKKLSFSDKNQYNLKKINTIISENISNWKNIHKVSLYPEQYNKIISKGYSTERVLNLLAILNMECTDINWNCYNGWDIWPFQINRIHDNKLKWKFWFSESKKLFNNWKWDELFDYQLDKANILLDSYDNSFCSEFNVNNYGLWNNYEEKKWRCVAFMYNWHPKYKFAYNTFWFKKRELIKKLLIENNLIK